MLRVLRGFFIEPTREQDEEFSYKQEELNLGFGPLALTPSPSLSLFAKLPPSRVIQCVPCRLALAVTSPSRPF